MSIARVFVLAALVVIAQPGYAKVPSGALSKAATEDSGPAVTFGAKAAVPIGYYRLCNADNPVCRASAGTVDQTTEGVVRLDGRLAAQLATVNADVNRSIRPVANWIRYGPDDPWSVEPKAGDCKDFALTKKARLLKLGWPSNSLLMALAYTADGGLHAVLIVRTDRGDFVLDNLRNDIRRWSAKLYRWESIQSPTEEWAWYQLGRGTVRMASRAAQPTDQVAVADRIGGPDDRGNKLRATVAKSSIAMADPPIKVASLVGDATLAGAALWRAPQGDVQKTVNLFVTSKPTTDWLCPNAFFASYESLWMSAEVETEVGYLVAADRAPTTQGFDSSFADPEVWTASFSLGVSRGRACGLTAENYW